MFTKRVESRTIPPTIQTVIDGVYCYNYDIQPKTVSVLNMDTEELEEEIRYSYIQVKLIGTPEYKKCVEAVIREYLDINEEFDLINSMNKLTMGLSTDENDRVKYQEYLELVNTIKTNVKSDFA